MKILPLDRIDHHIIDMSLKHVHVMHCESVQGWTIAVTVYTAEGGMDGFLVGHNGESSVYPSMTDAADAIADVGVQQFTVTQPRAAS